ncbi:hypothetical protein AQ505_07545 [Pedobacter sp. PACM 27299]|uniref:hypothetical protein n=1 Tax=Pedobacter sp. PACM 27299 TaxID=1727164 RepID=UPI000706DC4C|nr:hypothetical protein [Pedobacter sp. PACM 27299]ALL05355.1 hypothetical protein AQ505_07545 [Pedobacter sp. PACM 27299]
MKRFPFIFLFLVLSLIVSSCKKNTTEVGKDDPKLLSNRVTKVSNITDPNDPNLDMNWQWWNYNTHKLYFSPTGSITNIQVVDAFLPFYTQGNILNTGPELDMYPEDGWVLAFRDFGTPARPIDFPFFALYNKYRGTFRVMLYNAQQTQSSYLKGELSFVNPSYAGGLMTFNAEGTQAFLDSYDHSVKDHQITTSNQFSDWVVFDFNLSGYDPNYSPNAALKLQIHRINETNITLNSTAFTLEEAVKKSTPGGQGSDFANAINTGYTIADQATQLKKVLLESPGGKATGGILNKILTSSYAEAVPIIGQALGVIRAFIGGTTKPAPRQPLKFQGTLNFNGLATSGTTLYSRTFSLSSSSTVLSDYKPVQPITWGIFNLGTIPKMNISVVEGYGSDCNWYVDATIDLSSPTELLSNHVANGMILKKIKMGIITDPNDASKPIGFLENGPIRTTRRLKYGETVQNLFYGKELALALTYEIISPTRYLDKQITIYKAYSFQFEDLGKVRIDDCPTAGPGGIEW